MHRAVLLLIAVALVAGCEVDGGPAPADTPEPIDLAGLRETVAEVNELHTRGQAQLATTLDAVRELDLIIDEFRAPETIDEARETWPQVAEVVARAEIDELREPFFELAHAVDRARGELRVALERVDEDWVREALEAEGEALVVIREYAEEVDRLARTLITHWPTYEGITESTEEFVEQRWFYRDAEEAAEAYELAVSGYLDPLQIAQEEIGEALDRRDDAAERVNEAVAAASERWEQRPATPSPGGGDG